VSITFIDPATFIYYRYAIGIQTVINHKSAYIVDKINGILSRMNIESSDIWRAINDNANAAKHVGRVVASGRIPVDSKSTCIMHTANLILEHALGIRPRKREPNNEFLAGKRMCKNVHTALSLIMNKHNKRVFEHYLKICREQFQSGGLKFLLPNETRVAGKYLMIQSLLRQHRAFKYLTNYDEEFKERFSNINFTKYNWAFIQEMDGVMKKMGVLTIGTQTDQVGYILFCWYAAMLVRSTASSLKFFPLMKMTEKWDPDTPINDIPLCKRERKDLTPDTIIVLSRIVAECDRYLPKPDSDMRLAVYFNPVATKLVLL
jgi:hypothetical protein